MKKILFIFIFTLFSTEIIAQSTGSLRLYAGDNIITLGLANESGTVVKSLKIISDTGTFPNWLRVKESLIPVDFMSEEVLELSLQINVDQGHEGEVVSLPLILIGDTGHRWYVEPFVTIEVRKITKNELLPNFPNPFNPETTINYRLAGNTDQETKLVIYNAIGQEIRTLVQKIQPAGEYVVHWDGTDNLGQKSFKWHIYVSPDLG